MLLRQTFTGSAMAVAGAAAVIGTMAVALFDTATPLEDLRAQIDERVAAVEIGNDAVGIQVPGHLQNAPPALRHVQRHGAPVEAWLHAIAS